MSSKKEHVKLTPARASLLYALFAYESMGEYSSLFSANKLAYFLQRNGQKLNLEFTPYHYGPYSIGVEKVLYHLNGTYLKGLEQGKARTFEPLLLNYEKWEEVQSYVNSNLPFEDAQRVKSLVKFLNGFTSELSLEILSSVDFIIAKKPDSQIEDVLNGLAKWNLRKKQMFKPEFVQAAFDYLKEYSTGFPDFGLHNLKENLNHHPPHC